VPNRVLIADDDRAIRESLVRGWSWRSRRGDETEEPVDLAALAHRAADRVQRRTGREIRVDADGSVVRGRRQGLDRDPGPVRRGAGAVDPSGTSRTPTPDRLRMRPAGGRRAVGFTVDPARLLPDSEPDHAGPSPRSITVEET
jgi:hypothetical protein